MSVGGLATGGAAVRPTVSSDLDLLSAGASVVGVLGLFAVLFSAALANAEARLAPLGEPAAEVVRYTVDACPRGGLGETRPTFGPFDVSDPSPAGEQIVTPGRDGGDLLTASSDLSIDHDPAQRG